MKKYEKNLWKTLSIELLDLMLAYFNCKLKFRRMKYFSTQFRIVFNNSSFTLYWPKIEHFCFDLKPAFLNTEGEGLILHTNFQGIDQIIV